MNVSAPGVVERWRHLTAGRGRQVLMLAAVLALASADGGLMGASAREIRHTFGLTNADLGLLVSITTAVGAVVTIPAGALVDRRNRVKLLGVSIVLWGAAMAGSALAPNYLAMAASRVGLGVVSATGYPAVASLLGDYFPPSQRSRIYGLVLGGELVGSGAGLLVGAVLSGISWRLSFGVMAIPSVVVAAMLVRMGEPTRRQGPEGDDEWVPLPKAVAGVLKVRTNVVLIVAGACSYYFFAGVKTFGVEFATSHYRIGRGEATGFLALIGLGAFVGVVTGGRLGDRLEPVRHPAGRVLVAVIATEVAAVIFVPALIVAEVAVAVPLLMLAAAAWGAVGPPLDAARLSVMPPRLWGRAEGVRSVIRQGSEAVAPLLFGVVADSFGTTRDTGLQGAFLIMLIPLALAGALLALGLRTYPADAARQDSERYRPAAVDRSPG